MRKTTKTYAFTLVEVLVAITIFSIMMISVMGVYITSSEVTYKSDLNRFMQENVKNIVTHISEDVMNTQGEFNGKRIFLTKGQPGATKCFDPIDSTSDYNKLCFVDETVDEDILKEYFIGKKDSNGDFKRVLETSFCRDTDITTGFRNHCYIIMQKGADKFPITNDLVTVENLQFRKTGGDDIQNKVTVFVTLAIAPKTGVRESLIESTKLHTQFTISERNF